MKHKICTQCNEKKPIECYYRDRTIITKNGYVAKCKACCQKNQVKRKPNDKDLNLTNKICKDCNQDLPIDKFYKNARYKDGYFARCKKCHNSKGNTGYIIKRTKEYMNEYNKKRYKKPSYKIRSSIRKSIQYYCNKKKDGQKSSKYLGCTIYDFKDWIEYQFDDNMNWENHGSYWHFDHVKPCASFDLTDTDEILKCYSWKNYRPLEGKENIEKSDIIIPEIINNHKKLVKKYIKEKNHEITNNTKSSAPTLKNQVN